MYEMSDFYDVELRELLSGERKGEKMDPELKETVLTDEYNPLAYEKLNEVSKDLIFSKGPES